MSNMGVGAKPVAQASLPRMNPEAVALAASELTPEAPDAAGTPVMRLGGITKIYPLGGEAVRALRGVDLTIGRNEFVAIMGPSGSGKSTLMNILGCLDVQTDGSYWLDGRDVARMSQSELARERGQRIG